MVKSGLQMLATCVVVVVASLHVVVQIDKLDQAISGIIERNS